VKRWEVGLSVKANLQLAAIKDTRLRETLKSGLKRLEYEPGKQGKPLSGELKGYRSVRAAGQRYRILYRLEAEQVVVVVAALGIRREGDKDDIYEIAKKLKRAGLLGDE
jgi:mRNA interferase RelE/StbE